MKVSEAIDLLKKYPKDCEIYLKYPNDCEIHHCKEWEDTDENGNIICPNHICLYRLQDVTIADGMDKAIIMCSVDEEPTIID